MIDLKQVNAHLLTFKNADESLDAYLKDISVKISALLPNRTPEQVEDDLFQWWASQKLLSVFNSDAFRNLGRKGSPAPQATEPTSFNPNP